VISTAAIGRVGIRTITGIVASRSPCRVHERVRTEGGEDAQFLLAVVEGMEAPESVEAVIRIVGMSWSHTVAAGTVVGPSQPA
jgi:hypothetical protein